VLGILRNPMILVGLASMAVFLGLPYLVDSMDPEMRAEFEERQKGGASGLLGGGAQPAANPMANFDMAAYLAGGSKKDSSGSAASNGGGKKSQGVRR